MIGLLGGLVAALAWGSAAVFETRASRLVGARVVLAWVMLSGLVLAVPFALFQGRPSLDGAELAWLLTGCASIPAALGLLYAALRIGKVSLVAPIVATQGAIGASLAVLTGDSISLAASLMLGVIAVGVCLASLAPDAGPVAGDGGGGRRALAIAVASALFFGYASLAAGRVGNAAGAGWVVAVSRVMGTAAVTLPVLLQGRLWVPRAALWRAALAGVLEAGGFAAFIVGARHGIAVPAVISSQAGAISALLGYAIFGERLRRVQLAGVVAMLAGVGALTALTV